jgi:hypothetical protein
MKIDKETLFAVKVAFFDSLSFCVIIGTTVIVDPKLTTFIGGAGHYRFGYWALLFSPFMFLGTLWCMKKLASWKMKAVCPSLIVAFVGICSLPFFVPEVPHWGILCWALDYSVASLLISWIHYFPIEPNWLNDKSVDKQLRVERVKEAINLWRSFAISVTFGYVALVVPWTVFNWNFPSRVVTSDSDKWLGGVAGAINFVVLTLFALFGLISESFRKAVGVADLLLRLKE